MKHTLITWQVFLFCFYVSFTWMRLMVLSISFLLSNKMQSILTNDVKCILHVLSILITHSRYGNCPTSKWLQRFFLIRCIHLQNIYISQMAAKRFFVLFSFPFFHSTEWECSLCNFIYLLSLYKCTKIEVIWQRQK